MRKFKDFEFHRRRFIGLAIVIFTLVAVLHIARVVFGWDLVVGGVVLPMSVSILAIAILAMMIVMGVYYYFS